MKNIINNIRSLFPVQLFVLHFEKYQVLLVFWYILTSTINSGFYEKLWCRCPVFLSRIPRKSKHARRCGGGHGARCFIMSWNITTFILHSKRCKFLATTSKPFLKYCINNALLPLLFIAFYVIRLIKFNRQNELMNTGKLQPSLGGLFLVLFYYSLISFIYFFGAERTIIRTITPIVSNPHHFKFMYNPAENPSRKALV